MARQHEQPEHLTLTASLTTGVARVTHGMQESLNLIDEILTMDHVDWETTLSVGDVEFHSPNKGRTPIINSESAYDRQQALRRSITPTTTTHR
jgi:ABC-type nitrate/sulfonate/bicarbonate transport system ATPase subunit